MNLAIKGNLEKLVFDRFRIKEFSFDGNISPQLIAGNVRIDDPYLRMTATPEVRIGNGGTNVLVSSNISRLHPKGFQLTDKYGDSDLSAMLSVSYTSDGKSYKEGFVNAKDIKISENGITQTECDSLNIRYLSKENHQKVSLESDFAEAQVQSDCPLEDIPPTLLAFASHSFPSLRNFVSLSKNNAKRDIAFSLLLKDTKTLSSLVKTPIQIDKPASLTGYLDVQSQQLNITSWIPEFSYNGEKYLDGTAYIKGNADSLHLLLQVTKMFEDSRVKIVCNTPVYNNVLYPQIEWKTLDSNGSTGTVSAECSFSPKGWDNGNTVSIDVKPSHFTIKDTLWTISPTHLQIAKHAFRISPLELRRGNQYISIHNESSTDSPFLITINGMEISHLQDLLNFHPVNFSGKIYGTASIPSQPTDSTSIPISLRVDDFHFQGGDMGNLYVKALMDGKFRKIDLQALTQESANDSMRIKGYVDIAENSLELNFSPQKTNAAFLNSWLKGVLGPISGRISGDLQLKGPLNALDFHGGIRLDTLAFRPPVTNAVYTSSNNFIRFEEGKFIFQDFRMYDNRHGSCVTTGNVTHNHLKYFGYDFRFDASNFHAYNWDDSDRDLFWGKVYVDGNGRLYGTTSQVHADINISPQTGSVFYYNNSSTESASTSEFVRFHNGGNTTNASSATGSDSDKDMKLLQDNTTDVYLNMTARSNPNLQFVILTDRKTGDGLYLRGQGPLNISWYNKGNFLISGLYSTTGGEYHLTIQDLMRRNFKIQPNGYLRFSGNPNDGDLNLKGIYSVHSVSLSDLNVGQNLSNATTNVDCLLNFGGKANNPVVTFGLDFPTAGDDMRQSIHGAISSQEDLNMQMLYLLTVGRFYTYDYENSTNSSTQNQSVLAMQSLFANTLGNSLSNVLSQVLNISNWSFGPNLSTGKMGWDDMEVGGQFQGSLLKNRIQLSGNFGYREQNTYSNNFVGDFNLRWLLNPKGTISLKAYSETNDRYFSRSSLSTQGGGIQFQHNFNLLRDIFGTRKTKTASTNSK